MQSDIAGIDDLKNDRKPLGRKKLLIFKTKYKRSTSFINL